MVAGSLQWHHKQLDYELRQLIHHAPEDATPAVIRVSFKVIADWLAVGWDASTK